MANHARVSSQQHYERQAPATLLNAPIRATLLPAPEVAGAGVRLAKAALEAGGRVLDVAAREYERDETTRVEESLLAMRRELSEERDRYMREHQGQDALKAGEHFDGFARDVARRYLSEGKFQGRFAEAFMKQAAGQAIQFTEQGMGYAAREREAWNKSVLDGKVSEFLRDAALDFRNIPRLQEEWRNLKDAVGKMRPGMDNTAYLNDIGRRLAGSVIDGHLAEDDLRGARESVERFRDFLGADANAYAVKIRGQADALRAKAEAQRKKAEQDAEEARIERGYNDVMSGINGLPSTLSVEERKAKLVQLTADMEPKLRAAVRKRGEADIDERELVRKAGIVEELGMVDRMRKANPQATSNEMISLIRESNLSDDAKTAGIEQLEKERESAGNNELSAAGLREFRAIYDARNGDMSETEARALAHDLNLNAKDMNSALTYDGRGMEYSQTRIDGLITSVLGKGTSGNRRSKIYAALMKRIPAGENWDDKRIKAEIYNLAQQERGWFANSFGESILKDEGGRFRPDIPEAMRNILNSELERDYPFFSSLPEKTRQLMRQGVWLRRQYGITPEWTEEERKLLERAGSE